MIRKQMNTFQAKIKIPFFNNLWVICFQEPQLDTV